MDLSFITTMLLITALRTTDVTLNVFKTVAIVQGRRLAAPGLQIAESGAWLAAAGIVFSDMTPAKAIGFLLGVGLGTVIGMEIVRRLRLGMVTVRIYDGGVPSEDGERTFGLAPPAIREAGFGATVFDGRGQDGPVEMTLSTVRRREAQRVVDIVASVAPHAFVSIDNEPVALRSINTG